MTDTEAKALALVNEFRAKCAEPTLPVTMSHVWAYGAAWEALCRVIKREAATEARHAAELREQAERFSEVLVEVRYKTVPLHYHDTFGELAAPFILPKPDPVSEWLAECSDGRVSDHTMTMLRLFHNWLSEKETRKIGEAGE